MSQITISQLLDKAPDAQFVGGVVLLHVESTNVEIGKLMPGEVVELTEAGDDLLESAAAPEKKTRKRKVVEVAPEPAPEVPADATDAAVAEPPVEPEAQ